MANFVSGNANTGAEVVTNVDNTIQGAGYLGWSNSFEFINGGTINANGTKQLIITPTVNAAAVAANGGGFVNTGVLEATNTGGLLLNGGKFNNNGGTIKAAGGDVTLQSTTIVGGTLASSGSNVIQSATGTNNTLDGSSLGAITLAGTYQATNNTSTYLSGTFINNGKVQVNSTGNNTWLNLADGTQLTGGGTITLSDKSTNYITGATSTGTEVVTNVNNNIQGAGHLGWANSFEFINKSGNVIDANGTNQLIITPTVNATAVAANGGGFVNQGTLKTTNTGGLLLYGGQFNNNGGTIKADGGNVTLQATTISGGTLASSGSNVIQNVTGNSATLDGSSQGAITLAGTYQAANNSGTYLSGTFKNNGEVQVNSTVNNTWLYLADGTQLTGGGKITLTDKSTNYITGAANTGTEVVTNVNNTIQGAGHLGWTNSFGLLNGGTVDATGSNALILAPTTNSTVTAGLVNQAGGVLRGSGAGGLEITQGKIDNQGTVEALANSKVVFDTSATVLNNNGNTLTGGIWKANSVGGSSATIDFQKTDTSIATNNADIYLIGANSVIQGRNAGSVVQSLDSTLSTNNGSLHLQQGRTFNATASSGIFTNNGLLEVTDSTFQSGALANNGINAAISGFGTSMVNTGSIRVTGSGAITANTGTLTLTGGVFMGGGSSLTSNAGATVNISGATTFNVIETLANNGNLNLGSQNITVQADYTNANFGVGNSFNNHANVAGPGLILANGDVGISVSGTGISNGTSATPTLALGNVHVNATDNGIFNINTTGSTGPVIRGAIKNSGITTSGLNFAAQNFGPIALGGSTAINYSYAPTTAGALSGQTFNVVTNFDNVTGKTVAVTGTAYNLAAGSATPTPVTIANQRIGGTNSQALTVSNTAASGSYTEVLNASFGTNTDSATNNGGTITGGLGSGIAGGASNSSAMSVGVNTSNAGLQTGKVTLNYVSNGTGTSDLGNTSVGSQTIDVSGNVYQKAAGLAQSPAQVANQRIGGNNTTALTVSNNTTFGTGYVEDLNASVGGTLGATASGSLSKIIAGRNNLQSGIGSILAGVDTTSAGAKTGTVTLNYETAGTVNGFSNGLGTLGVGSQDVTVTGNVYQVAQATLPTTVDLGKFHVGTGFPTTLSQAITIGNTLVASGFQEGLNVTANGTSGQATVSGGPITNLAAGSTSNALSLGLSGLTAGVNGGTATLALATNGSGTSGLGVLSQGNANVNVTGTGYNLASSNVIAPIKIVAHTGDGGGSVSQTLSITNVSLGNNTYQEGLNSSFGGFIAGSGNTITPTLTGSIFNLAAGATDNSSMKVAINTLTAGLFNGIVTVDQASNGLTTSGLGITSLASQQIAATGQVTVGTFNYATPTVNTSLPINFGNIRQGSNVANQAISISNTAPVSAFTEALNGSVVSAPAGFSATGSFNGLQAGAPADTNISVGMSTSSAGHQAGNVILGFVSDGTGIVGDGTTTAIIPNTAVAVTGNVFQVAQPTLPTAVNLGATRVGGSLSGGLNVSNTLIAPVGYQEGLNANVSSTSGATASGSISNLGAGATDSTSITVGLDATSSGVKNGAVTLGLKSNGSGTSGLNTLDLPDSGPISVTGKVYQTAVAVVTPTVDFGIVHVGDNVTKAINVANTASGSLVDSVTGKIASVTGAFSNGNGTLGTAGVAAGENSNALTVKINTGAAGMYAGGTAGIANLALFSHDSDLLDIALNTNPVTLQGTVNNYAKPVFKFDSGKGSLTNTNLTTFNLDFGNVLQNSINDAFLKLLNDVTGPADLANGYFSTPTGAKFTLTGFGTTEFSPLAAGESLNGLEVAFDTSALGAFSGSITLTEWGTNDSGYRGPDTTIVLNFSGDVVGQQAVPEPSTLILAGIGLMGIGLLRRKNRS